MPIDNILRAALKNGKSGVIKNVPKTGLKNGLNEKIANSFRENGASTPYIKEHLRKLKFNQSPIGRKGQSKNMKAFGYMLRDKDPLITNKEMNEAWDQSFGKEARIFEGEEYTFQPAGTQLTKETDISKAGMRPLMTKSKSAKDAGKKNVNNNRKPHYTYMKEQHPEWVQDYTAKNARAKMLNKQEIERRRAQGEKVSDKAQFVMFEHDVAIRSPRWATVKGANIPSNTFVNTNYRARTFKDSLESWFYTKMKTRGNNFELRTNRLNQKDIEVYEISTGKLLFSIPFPEKFEVGESFAFYLSKDDILKRMRKTATTFTG